MTTSVEVKGESNDDTDETKGRDLYNEAIYSLPAVASHAVWYSAGASAAPAASFSSSSFSFSFFYVRT